MRTRIQDQPRGWKTVARTMTAAAMAAALPLLVPSLAAAQTQVPAEVIIHADTILTNGKVLTVDSNFSIQEALAIRASP